MNAEATVSSAQSRRRSYQPRLPGMDARVARDPETGAALRCACGTPLAPHHAAALRRAEWPMACLPCLHSGRAFVGRPGTLPASPSGADAPG